MSRGARAQWTNTVSGSSARSWSARTIDISGVTPLPPDRNRRLPHGRRSVENSPIGPVAWTMSPGFRLAWSQPDTGPPSVRFTVIDTVSGPGRGGGERVAAVGRLGRGREREGQVLAGGVAEQPRLRRGEDEGADVVGLVVGRAADEPVVLLRVPDGREGERGRLRQHRAGLRPAWSAAGGPRRAARTSSRTSPPSPPCRASRARAGRRGS